MGGAKSVVLWHRESPLYVLDLIRLTVSPREDQPSAGVSKNLRTRSQADTDLWHELFDTQTSPVAGVSSLSTKRTVYRQDRN